MKEWFTVHELAAMRLPDMPHTGSGIARRAKIEHWSHPDLQWPSWPTGTWRKRKGRGGGVEYSWRVLPLPTLLRFIVAEGAVDIVVAAYRSKAEDLFRARGGAR